jgi:hypothetical protein
MKQSILKNINNSIASILIASALSLFALNTHATDIDLQDIEEALGVKVKSECKEPPCPVDVNALLDKLTYEHAKEHKTSKLTDTPQAIESSKDSPLMKMERAELIVLNKITAKSVKKAFSLGEIKFFGNLSIEVHKCVKSTDPFNANNLMLLTIFDNKIDDDNLSVFHGWIVSSNPSISTLEHPVYEVISVDCVSKGK